MGCFTNSTFAGSQFFSGFTDGGGRIGYMGSGMGEFSNGPGFSLLCGVGVCLG